MANQTGQRIAKAGQWLRAGMMSAAVIKPVVDQMMHSRALQRAATTTATTAATQAVRDDHFPLSQLQLDKLAKSISDRVVDLTEQAQSTANRELRRLEKVDARIWWAAGITLGFAAAGVTTFTLLRRRLAQRPQPDDLVPLPMPSTNGHQSPSDRLRGAVSRITQRGAGNPTATNPATITTPHTAAAAIAENERIVAQGNAMASDAPFVGNIKTLIYHPSDSDHLPAEENRIYFKSEKEAEDAGYHLATGE